MTKDRKLMIRLPEEQHRAFRVRAAELDYSMAEIVRTLVDAWLEGKVKLDLPAKKGEQTEE